MNIISSGLSSNKYVPGNPERSIPLPQTSFPAKTTLEGSECVKNFRIEKYIFINLTDGLIIS